jgi:hypothetical protein
MSESLNDSRLLRLSRISQVSPGCSWAVQFQHRKCVLNGIGHEKEIAVLRLEHSFLHTMVKKGEKFVVEAIRIQQENGFLVEFKGVPSEDFEELLEGTEASRQGDEGVGLFSDKRLACVHGARDVKFRDAVVGNFEIYQNLRNNAYDSTVGC